MQIGAHVSTKGGMVRAVDVATAIGATVMQTHPSSPQQWRPLTLDDQGVASFRASMDGSAVTAHFFHGIYLINLATDNPVQLQQSIDSLVHSMDLAERLGATGVIFHPGSHKGAGFDARVEQMGAAMREVLRRTTPGAKLIVENSAGAGGCVGCRFEEVGALLAAAGSPNRVGVCLDTCHAFASGYDLRATDDVARTLDDFDAHVGFDRLIAVHANDSRAGLGSHADRHANIGEGRIGDAGFAAMLADDRLRAVPWLLETPGDGGGPRRQDVEHLRTLAGMADDGRPPRAEPLRVGVVANRDDRADMS